MTQECKCDAEQTVAPDTNRSSAPPWLWADGAVPSALLTTAFWSNVDPVIVAVELCAASAIAPPMAWRMGPWSADASAWRMIRSRIVAPG